MTTFIAALLLAQVTFTQPDYYNPITPLPPPAAPAAPAPPENPSSFQPDVTDSTQLSQDFNTAEQTEKETAASRTGAYARDQRLRLYESALKKLGNIDAAIAQGEGRQEDELGEARATIEALRNANPGAVSETSNLAIGSTAVANAELAERQSNDEHARAEIRRARQALTDARMEAQSPTPR